MPDRASRRRFLKTSGELSATSLLGAGLGGCAGPGFPATPLSAAEQLQLNSVQAVEAIRSGRLPAQTYVTTLLARAEALKDLNAMIVLDSAGALAAARRIDAMRDSGNTLPRLAGLPIVVKDNINTANLPTTGGTAALRGIQPKSNAPSL
jgi:mandelamide amidase